MKPSSSIRYCWRVLGRSSRPRVLRRSSHWSPYALIVGTALREAPRAARVRSRSTCSTTELLLDADPPRACVSRLVRSVFGPSGFTPKESRWVASDAYLALNTLSALRPSEPVRLSAPARTPRRS